MRTTTRGARGSYFIEYLYTVPAPVLAFINFSISCAPSRLSVMLALHQQHHAESSKVFQATCKKKSPTYVSIPYRSRGRNHL